MVKEMEIVQPFNLKLKSLNQIFVFIQMHIFLKLETKKQQVVMLIEKLHLKTVLHLGNV